MERKLKATKKPNDTKLPPINENKENILKTIVDIDPHYYSLIDGRPIKTEKSISKYKQNIRDIALKRTLTGLLRDEILRIDREIKTEREMYETASKNFDEYKNSFDKFLADNNNKTIIVMRKSDNLSKELANKIEDHKKANYELASVKSKVQYINESLQILLSFQSFLYNIAPILWQQSNPLILDGTDIINIESDIFQRVDVDGIKFRLSKLPPPLLYFETPGQLPHIFELLEKQNLNYLLVTENLNAEKVKFVKSLETLKDLMRQDLEFIQLQIKEIEDAIEWNKTREEDLKNIFYSILEDKIKYIVSSEAAIEIFNYVEFTYERLVAPNDAKLSSFDMTLCLEREYNDLMLLLSTFDTNSIKSIEKELYENEAKIAKQAVEANKMLKDVRRLNRRLQSAYEPPRYTK
ncbi:uncharacterized protein LOC121739329 [Aricia agestis]|uniref:uncharacterized protein LOC121739329 n=1 Tax=Aricia agestis TaxID=91739 RepID=UPI001C20A050|nr:uncharacterized protein LOC121739329 [Aricia agestis]